MVHFWQRSKEMQCSKLGMWKGTIRQKTAYERCLFRQTNGKGTVQSLCCYSEPPSRVWCGKKLSKLSIFTHWVCWFCWSKPKNHKRGWTPTRLAWTINVAEVTSCKAITRSTYKVFKDARISRAVTIRIFTNWFGRNVKKKEVCLFFVLTVENRPIT